MTENKLELNLATLEKNKSNSFQIIEIHYLPGNAYILRFNRNGMEFKPGHHIHVAPQNNFNYREYSIYSGISDPYIEILVKVVENGYLSNKLKKAKPGDYLEVHGPFGHFTIKEENLSKPFLFIASGTGISPFHSFVLSYPNLNYTLIHGVKYYDEAYDHGEYDPTRYVLCTSQDAKGNFYGRLTGYLEKNEFDLGSEIYLCGNNNMIFDAVNLLLKKGFSHKQVHTEVYF